jgi:hypothetical protein
MKRLFRLTLVLGASWILSPIHAADNPISAALEMKSESFDYDPGWEGYNNHILEGKGAPVVKQDFGYSATHFAGKTTGEIGGSVQRAITTAYYADQMDRPLTLDNKLTASGSFAITATQANAGVFFGWFDSRGPDGSGRPTGSLGMNFDFEKHGGRLAVRLIAGTNQACGTFITPFIPGKFRPTPIHNDGTRYHWTMSYDPEANHGDGQFQYTVRSESQTPEEFEGKTFSVDLPPGLRKAGANFDRFGLVNMTKAGSAATIYFADLKHDGKDADFTHDPGWVGQGNRITYEDHEKGGAQNYGYMETNHAGGTKGEMGGLIWRAPYGFYADRIAPVTLADKLEARGRIILQVGAPDSGVLLGWFNSKLRETSDKNPLGGRAFFGAQIGGPTRVGHYFLPICHSNQGRAMPKSGPVLAPGRAYEWTLLYDPASNGGRGEMRATLGGESVTLEIRKMNPQADTTPLDRFGLFTLGTGGGQIKLYVDDLKYSVGGGDAAVKRGK